jgi:hypothetical protein
MFQKLRFLFSNLFGWRTKRKFVIFESDDWGSIRMPSLSVYHELKKLGVPVDIGDGNRYNQLDTIESSQDMEMLFASLASFKDINGNYPVFTAMSLSANPDFERIRSSGFNEYFFEPITTTFEKYQRASALNLWKQGENDKIFVPEFHGREHLNVRVWIKALRARHAPTLEGFYRGFWGFNPNLPLVGTYQAAFDLESKQSLEYHKSIIDSGIELFHKLHGRKPVYFVPPNGPINVEIEQYAASKGFKYICSGKLHQEPLGEGKFKKHFRYIGLRNTQGALFLTRNCFFEPSYRGSGFSVDDCLNSINNAFMFSKPAIISTHRVNYIGGLSRSNAEYGNKLLKELISRILHKWPDVEFLTSVQLGEIIQKDKG